MFRIQSTKTKMFIKGILFGKSEWTKKVEEALKFDDPGDADEYINHWCSATSRSHVVYLHNNELWNVSKQATYY